MEKLPELSPEKRAILQALGASVAEKRARLQSLGMIGVSDDEVQRMQLSMQYSQAQADLWNAEGALRAALAKE
jgi:hypothetical protein